MAQPVFIIGGSQTDFARNWAREGSGLHELMDTSINGALDQSGMAGSDIEVAHIGNFVGELFAGQGNLGGFLATINADLMGIPASRHEGACASGSLAILAATADIEACRYGTALVTGVELMRNVPGRQAADFLGAAAWQGRETDGRKYVWPSIFSDLLEFYQDRYGIEREHLAAISRKNFDNAKANPLAQTRHWEFPAEAFGEDDDANPVIEGSIRRSDCGQVTDGAATVILAGEKVAAAWAARHGKSLADLPRISCWGHTSAPMMLADKLKAAPKEGYLFPMIRKAITDAFKRADIPGHQALDGIELHDCFSITEYMLTEHFGLAAPGEAWKAIEAGDTLKTGKLPVNASGGLIGGGHPVGATGIRMLLDASKQVTGQAGDCQIDGARRMATMNIGGSGVTNVSFIVER
ncbi:acetyl-CoA acetyltransferase [Kordiimonas lacus]|uniref:Acetyl-CoA C-acetyltransferase n=1 Tax=Kordiimonas lacus TaxID=637679 RepID=A0A1G6YQT7_9PROT|nr:acetyl-CoA acetyltransferase [Kordiimonas lacus]SDD91906.1 acetyl-CoA C-acetyltransferase [Kordiimonas lacus]